MNGREHLPLEVLCSCGRTTVLRWDGEKYRADDPAWVYGSEEPETLWSCGRPGHVQRWVRDWPHSAAEPGR